MTDTPHSIGPGQQRNFKRGPAKPPNSTYDRLAAVDLKAGEEVIVRSGGAPPPPPPGPVDLALFIVDADTEHHVEPLDGGETIKLATLPHFSIEATGLASTGSVVWDFTGHATPKVDDIAPFTLFGDIGADILFWDNPVPGPHTVKATAWSGKGGTGTKLGELTRQFSIVAAPPEPPPPPPQPGADVDGTSTKGAFGLALPPVLPGLTVAFYTNFDDEVRALGQGFGPKLLKGWRPRPDVARDGSYPDSSTRGTYSTKWSFEERDSLARFYAHSFKPGGDPLKHDPNGTEHVVYAPLDQQNDQDEIQVSFSCKFPTILGRKMAHLYWAFGKEINGEIDIPEGKLDGGDGKGNLFIHPYMSSAQVSVRLNLNFQVPHGFDVYFRRQGKRGASDKGQIVAKVDNKVVHSGTAEGIPHGMHWVGQFETYLKGQAIPVTNVGSGWAEYDKYRCAVAA